MSDKRDFGPLNPYWQPVFKMRSGGPPREVQDAIPVPDMSVSPLPWRAGTEEGGPEIVDAAGRGVIYPGDIGGIATEGDRQLIINAVNAYEDLTLALKLANELLATYHEQQMASLEQHVSETDKEETLELAKHTIRELREELYKVRRGK